jgi:hypothetical protein
MDLLLKISNAREFCLFEQGRIDPDLSWDVPIQATLSVFGGKHSQSVNMISPIEQ